MVQYAAVWERGAFLLLPKFNIKNRKELRMKKLTMAFAIALATFAFAQEVPTPACACKAGAPCICGEKCECAAKPACACKAGAPCVCGKENCDCPKPPKCGMDKRGFRGKGPGCGMGAQRPDRDVPRFVKCNCCPECKGLILLPPANCRFGMPKCGKPCNGAMPPPPPPPAPAAE